MRIYINGETHDVSDGTTMSNLIRSLDLGDQRIAVEVNTELVPRSGFESHRLAERDKVEIIHAVGGG